MWSTKIQEIGYIDMELNKLSKSAVYIFLDMFAMVVCDVIRIGKFMKLYTVNILSNVSNLSSAKNLNTLTHLLHDIYYEHLPSISPSINVRLTLMQFELTRWINDFE